MRVAYVVSRFPMLSETFIVRELDAVEAHGGVDVELLSLFSTGEEPAVHRARGAGPRGCAAPRPPAACSHWPDGSSGGRSGCWGRCSW